MQNSIIKYGFMSPAEAKLSLRADMKRPEFRKVAIATFGNSKYYLKPDKFLAYLDKKHPEEVKQEGTEPLTTAWKGWTMLDAMASGYLSGDEAKRVLGGAWLELTPGGRGAVLMILDKTWRNGVTQTLINEVCPGTFRPVKLMLAHKLKDRLAHDEKQVAKGKPATLKWPMLATYKYDGFRGGYHYGNNVCYSRQGNAFPLTPELKMALAKLSEHLTEMYEVTGEDLPEWGGPLALDGELYEGTWKATAEARAVGYDHMVVFSTMFDDNVFGEGSLFTLDVEDFFDDVQKFVVENHLTRHISVPKYVKVDNPQEVQQAFSKAISEGFEGLIVRPYAHAWEPKRSYHWLKVKAEETEDLVITGWEMSEERSRNAGLIGSILVDREGVESGASGMSDDLRKRLTDMGEDIIGLLAEIQYHELTPDGKLRHAVIKKIRFDKGANS